MNKHYCYNCNTYFTEAHDCEQPQYNFGVVKGDLKELCVDDYVKQQMIPKDAVQYYFPMYTDEFAKQVAYDRAYFIGGLYAALRSLYSWYTHNKHWNAYPLHSQIDSNKIYYKREIKECQNQFKK